MTAEQFKAENPIDVFCEARGIKLLGSGNHRMARCPIHEDRKPSFSVDVQKGLWKCFGGCGGGSVIDLIMQLDGKSVHDILGENEPVRVEPVKRAIESTQFVCDYIYEDKLGRPVFKVNRYRTTDEDGTIGKTFRQESLKNGQWVSGMKDVERVPYRLPQVLAASEVWVVEGEKDADNLSNIGFCATTNVGGGGNWKDGYAGFLKDKEVVICTDRDKTGLDHQQAVFDSVSTVAKHIRIVAVPSPHKDVSDFIAADQNAAAVLARLRDEAVPHYGGVKMPLYSMDELEARYIEHVKSMETDSFALGRWLPSFNRLRPLVPGELVMIVGNTGIGKTALLSSLALATRTIPTVMFQLELPAEMLFERLLAGRLGRPCIELEKAYASGDEAGKPVLKDQFPNIQLCCESGYSLAEISSIVERAELKMDRRPKLVLIDYVQLIDGAGKDRRDKFSNIAEGLKVMAKRTRTIVVIASQVSRPDSEDPEVGLHDAKETGSLENSCGLVLGAWRDPKDHQVMILRVLKSTKGGAGLTVRCNYYGDRMSITEKADV